jgi:integrase
VTPKPYVRRSIMLRMVRKRALAVGIMAPIGNHSFRATGITAYLENGGTLEHAQGYGRS